MAGPFNIADLRNTVAALGGAFINNITALRATPGTTDNQIVFVSEYNSGTDVGGGALVWNSTSTAADNGVTVFAVTGVATGRWLRQYEQLTVEMAGVVLDNTIDSTTAVQRAVNVSLALGIPLGGAGTALVTANITSLHSIKTVGSWAIRRGTDTYRAEPKGSEENVIYVGAGGLAGNDGLTSALPTTMAQAITIMKSLGAKAGDGVWRIQLNSGTMTFDGVRPTDLPLFRNKLRIWGADVALTATPISIWDGTSATQAFAFRMDSGDSVDANLHFKNIKFINWMAGSGNKGAILVWAHGTKLCENIHVDNTGVGIWLRNGDCTVTHGRITNVDTYGIGIQYRASGSVGDLSGGGVYIRGRSGGSAIGVAVGRITNCYIQGNDIDQTQCHINATRLSRFRTQANTYGANYTVCCVWYDNGAVWTPDNNSGYPDIYPTLTEAKPATRCEAGAVHSLIDRLGQRSLHACSDGGLVTITNTTQTRLSSINGSMTPFRLPKWFLYSPTFRLDVEIGISLAAGAGGVLTLNGDDNTSASQLATITIPNVGSATKGVVKISVIQSSGVSTARYSVEFRAANILSEMNNTVALNTTPPGLLRSNAEDDLVYRLHWTSNNANQVELFNMRTYVEP